MTRKTASDQRARAEVDTLEPRLEPGFTIGMEPGENLPVFILIIINFGGTTDAQARRDRSSPWRHKRN